MKNAIELREKLKAVFPYRQSEARWVGPSNDVNVIVVPGKECDMTGGSSRIWSSNGKWSGTDSYYSLRLRPSEDFEVIGGMVTVFSKKDKNKKVMKCTWFSQSRGYELNRHQGYLVCGYHTEASTKEKAIATAKAHRTRIIKMDMEILTPEKANKKWGFCMTGIKNFMVVNEIEKQEITFGELKEIVNAHLSINCKTFQQHLRKIGIVLNCA